eukprot:3935546-Rhodomonas_salina.1
MIKVQCRHAGQRGRKAVQQRCRPEKSSALPWRSAASWRDLTDRPLPVTSLDQLYTQASGAQFLLQ